ncbi:uncharacterized protein LOC111086224 [Limulus polyphemus]|uniref:Uncharacterized protein LOC111086224 n=1 Tax=Limulus polyphemus TaxID=6850 RepID=A0ABM1SJT6_LIMPO|nr:uncharacterized protein LOC111086224 [Limulus polyphemus]
MLTATMLLVLLIAGSVGSGLSEQNAIKHFDVQNIDQAELDALLKFAVREIEKLKLDHHELDECHGLEVASILRGRKQEKEGVRYSLTLKVQSSAVDSKECQKKTSSFVLQPEICEVEVSESMKKGTVQRTLLRSACLQVEELLE